MKKEVHDVQTKPRPIRRSSKGFTLLEMLIVVAIILLIVAIALPQFAKARTSAAQAATTGNLKTLYTAENQFQDEWGAGFQPLNLLSDAALTTPATCASPNLLPIATLGVATPTLGGYNYAFTASGGTVTLSATQTAGGCTAGTTAFTITATPVDPNARGYLIDSTGIIRYCLPAAAACTPTATSPVLGS